MINNSLLTRITEAIHQEADVQQLIAQLQKEGFDAKTINSTFKQALAVQSATVNAPAVEGSTSAVASRSNSPLDATKTFVFVGLLLIIIAVIVVFTLLWGSASPTARIVFVLLPVLILYLISFATRSKASYIDIHDGTLFTATLLLPFGIATALYQIGIIPTLSPLLIFYSSLVGYIGFIILEFVLHKDKVSPITLLTLYVLFGSLLWHFKIQPDVYYILLSVLSVFLTGFGVWLYSKEKTVNARSYVAFSVVLLYLFFTAWLVEILMPAYSILWALIVLSLAVASLGWGLRRLTKVDGDTYLVVGIAIASLLAPAALLMSLNYNSSLSESFNAILVSLFGLLYLSESIFIGRLARSIQSRLVSDLKRFLEEIAPLVVIVPLLSAGLSNIGLMILAVALSFGFIYVSITLPLLTLLPIGTLGLVVGIITITQKYFVDSLTWPITIFVAGFAMIGLSFLVHQVTVWKKSQSNNSAIFDIGEDIVEKIPDQANESKGLKRHFSCFQTIIILALVFMVLPWILSLVFSYLLRF